RQVLAALEALHAAGIVHGDVKTDNLLVERLDDGSDRVTLIDLGLAHPQFARDGVGERDELVSGTPEYMAPEVACGGPSTPASDIYGAGIVLYELIAGATPFRGGTPSIVIARQLHDDVVPPTLVDADRIVPPMLDRIV